MSTKHGTRAAGGRQVECVVDDLGNVFDLGHQVVVLGGRHGDAGGVGFLECVGADCRKCDLAGDADHGNRVHHGVEQER